MTLTQRRGDTRAHRRIHSKSKVAHQKAYYYRCPNTGQQVQQAAWIRAAPDFSSVCSLVPYSTVPSSAELGMRFESTLIRLLRKVCEPHGWRVLDEDEVVAHLRVLDPTIPVGELRGVDIVICKVDPETGAPVTYLVQAKTGVSDHGREYVSKFVRTIAHWKRLVPSAAKIVPIWLSSCWLTADGMALAVTERICMFTHTEWLHADASGKLKMGMLGRNFVSWIATGKPEIDNEGNQYVGPPVNLTEGGFPDCPM